MKKLLQRLVFVTATVAAGTAMASVTFFEGDDFVGRPFTANGVVADFRAYDFNDRALSMVVEGGPVEVCLDINFSGRCQVFNPGSYRSLLDSGWAHAISSVRPAYGQRGYDRRAYDQSGYDQGAYDQRGYDQGAYDRRAYDQRGYDQRGYDQRAQSRRDGWWRVPRDYQPGY